MKFIIIIFMMILLTYGVLWSSEYHVDRSKNNSVKFISSAPIENFEGNTKKIDGYVLIAETNALYDAEVYFEVDLNSVDTGIGLRNRHMREDYLHTDKYPIASFKGKINEVSKVSDFEYNVKVTGDMFIHGVTKKIMVSGKIFIGQNSMRITTNFIVKLTDYQIAVPKMMFLKISEDIQLVLDFNLKKVK